MAPQLRIVRILWFALFMSTCIYLVVVNFVPRPPAPTVPILLPVLGVLALFIGGMSAVWPNMMLKAGLRRANFPVTEATDMNAERMFRDLPAKTRVFADPKNTMQRAWALYQTPFILGMALAESIALFGLVLLFLGFSWPAAIGFFVLCWGIMVYHFPREARLRSAVESAYDASLR